MHNDVKVVEALLKAGADYRCKVEIVKDYEPSIRPFREETYDYDNLFFEEDLVIRRMPPMPEGDRDPIIFDDLVLWGTPFAYALRLNRLGICEVFLRNGTVTLVEKYKLNANI